MTSTYKVKEIATSTFIRHFLSHSKFKLVANIYLQAILSEKLIHGMGEVYQLPISKLKLVSYTKIKMVAIL